MFTEELGRNASRKKAEEAKEKRKRLKELQQRKAATSAQIASITTTTASADSGSNSNSTVQNVPSLYNTTGSNPMGVNTNILPPTTTLLSSVHEQSKLNIGTSAATTTTTSTTVTTTTGSKITPYKSNYNNSNNISNTTNHGGSVVLEIAAQQRQVRANIALQNRTVNRVQAIFRSYQCRKYYKNVFIMELQKKLTDIETLQRMLLNKSSTTRSYTLPVAMTTTLVRQFLFIVSSSSSKYMSKTNNNDDATNTIVLRRLLDFAVIPGLIAAESSTTTTTQEKNPFLSWIDTYVGKYRLHQFLQLLLDHYYNSHMDACLSSIVRCLHALLVGTSKLQLYCRSLMLPDKFNLPNNNPSTLDIIQCTRRQLLQMNEKPIPSDVETKRDSCFSSLDKNRVGHMFQLLLDIVIQPNAAEYVRYCQARMMTEIFTIPLLAWRLSSSAITCLVSPPSLPSPPPLMTMLEGMTTTHAELLNNGELERLLDHPDLSMTICPATGSQRLLANLLQLSRFIPSCNGEVVTTLDFTMAAKLFRFIAALVDVVPLGTFVSTRDSTITWITVDGNHKPIVLSPIIMEQCKSLLVEHYVRRMFLAAIHTKLLQTTDTVLATKNDNDLKHEGDWNESGNASAASLAAKEARIDRNKKFWNSSNWARKLTKGVSNLLNSSDSNNNSNFKRSSNENLTTDSEFIEVVAAGLLQDTSSLSRQLAEGKQSNESHGITETKEQQRSSAYTTDLLFALILTYSILLARWGGCGNDDIVAIAIGEQRATVKGRAEPKATSTPEAWIKSLLNVLCFSTPMVRLTWGIMQSDEAIIKDMYNLLDGDRSKNSIRSLSNRPCFASFTAGRKGKHEQNDHDGPSVFYLFLCIFSHVLIVTDDTEIHDMDRPIPLHQIRRCILVLRKLLYRVTCVDACSSSDVVSEPAQSQLSKDVVTNYFGIALISAASRTMRDLYDRSSRRPFCLPSIWTVSGIMEKEIGQCKAFADYQSLLATSAVLKVCPYMVSFKRRLKLFERIITTNRIEIQGENSSNPFHNNPLKPGIPVRITRARLLEDGIATMNNLGKNMRQRISVQYVNEAGAREIGIDAGGLFKEFWTDLCAIAFDPNYALFRVTDGGSDGSVGNCLYPNPLSAVAHGMEHTILFGFLGRILGKALYEGITIHPKFAHFFLSFLKGDYNFLHMLPDLSTVDSQLYSNLMFLKTYDGDASDLTLTFTVNVDEFGGTKEIPLITNGTNMDVTNTNKHYYIGLVAKYYVYDRIREQSEAMTRGLFEVVDRSWLRLFNEPELQVLISGASDGKLDVDDMKAHCHYAGGYSSIDRTVCKFWRVVASLDEKQQGALLRFVTSCERPPPLGFGSLNPPLTIQRVGILRDGDRLPTASTCFNILKLPTYSSEKILRQRLIYAIESGAGFELT